MTLLEWASSQPVPEPRLARQTQAVYQLMRYGEWWTFERLRAHIGLGISEAGLSARIRDLRKPPLNLTVERRPTSRRGVWEYRVTP